MLAGLTLLSFVRPGLLSLTHSQVLNDVITTASFLIAIGATFVALGEFLLYGRFSSLCVGLAFLLFVTAGVSLGLIPLLGGWDRNLAWIPYGWAVHRSAGGALLVVAGVMVDANIPLSRRARSLLISVSVILLFSLAVAVWVYISGKSANSRAVEAAIQLLAGILFFVASVRFLQVSRVYRRTWFMWLSFSLIIAGFAQLQYAIHYYPAGVVQAGDILSLVFFTGILMWLAADWSQNYRRLRWQTRELTALHDLMAVPRMESVGEVVQHVERVGSEAFMGRARVFLSDRDDIQRQEPLTVQMLQGAGIRPDGDGAPVVMAIEEGEGAAVACGVSLRSANRYMGMLLIIRQVDDAFTLQDVQLLRAFGAQSSVLLERTSLHEEVAAGAVLKERSRLAREIHDGLAQHLAFLKMRVAWLERSPSVITAAQLKDIESHLETALIEARHAITTLRAEPQGASMVDAVYAYLQEFSQVSGLEYRLENDETIPDLGPRTRVELMRIVQESLNNVRKHAQASCVWVTIRQHGEGVEVTVRDDGVGFAAGQELKGHFGLDIMRERVESVGGSLQVGSEPNVGTAVTLWVPGADGLGHQTAHQTLA